MNGLWTISSREVANLRGAAGERFTELMDGIIRIQTSLGGAADSVVRTNLKTTIHDGGVDTEVMQAVPNDQTGRLSGAPTIWQYKAQAYTAINPQEDVNKSYALECLKKGYAYRLCITDDMPPETHQRWERQLTEAVRRINFSAPPAQVLTASDIAAWANRFPGLILRFFRPEVGQACLHLEAWGQNLTSDTPHFVSIPAWGEIFGHLKSHLSFATEPPDIVFPVSGEAGVGKTRLVYESVSLTETARNLVLYTNDDENARRLARLLANDGSAFGILIADECPLQTRVELRDLLRGVKSRVRVITIDNSGERPATGAPEPWLEQIPEDLVQKILKENYPSVSEEKRRAYAELSGGFVRLAVYLCKQYMLGNQTPDVSPAQELRDIVRKALAEDDFIVLQAVSLIIRLGVSGDVAAEKSELCNLLNIPEGTLDQSIRKLHDGPGFIARAGRFVYVTPEIVARIALEFAWQRWAQDPQAFLRKIPASLLDPFLKRVAKSTTREEVRRIVADFFCQWANSVTPDQLCSHECFEQFDTLVEVHPETYLPILRRILEGASREDIRALPTRGTAGGWGSRRGLVWLAERIGSFQEYFEDAEKILLKLALDETEANIGNNSTEIWKQLFRVYLSGTAVPFLDRFKRLERRILSENTEIQQLGLRALSGIISTGGSRMLGPSIVGGRIPPPDWRPTTYGQEKACWDTIANFLQRGSSEMALGLQAQTRDVTLKHLRTLLTFGYLEPLKVIFPEGALTAKLRTQLIVSVEEFLHFHYEREPDAKKIPKEYAEGVGAWLESLKPRDPHGKLVSLIGPEPWHLSRMEREAEWQRELQGLARQCLEDPKFLEAELDWLNSLEAMGSGYFGLELGKLDREGSCLGMTLASATSAKSRAFTRGYIVGLLQVSPSHADEINRWLDQIEGQYPEVMYDLSLVGGRTTKVVERIFRSVDAGKLPVVRLGGLTFGFRPGKLTGLEFREVLKRLIVAIRQGDFDTGKVAVEFVAFSIGKDNKLVEGRILEDGQIKSLIWELLEATCEDGGKEHYWWGEIIQSLIKDDPSRAAKICTAGLVSDDFGQAEICEKTLVDVAQLSPPSVMQQLDEVLFGEKGWRFKVGMHRGLFGSLPADTVKDWLHKRGVSAARHLARHLGTPGLDGQGNPVVPEMAEYVLKTFEDDEETFQAFCAGTHSFQLYSGDIAVQHEKEGEVARRFLNHPLRRIREWAELELKSATQAAAMWRQEKEERWLH